MAQRIAFSLIQIVIVACTWCSVATAEDRDLSLVTQLKRSAQEDPVAANAQTNPVSRMLGVKAEPASSPEPSLLMTMVKGLGFCLGAFYLGLAIYRRTQGKTPAAKRRRMQVIERMSLGGKTSLCIVRIDGVDRIISVGPEHVTIGNLVPDPTWIAGGSEVATSPYSLTEELCEEDIRRSA